MQHLFADVLQLDRSSENLQTLADPLDHLHNFRSGFGPGRHGFDCHRITEVFDELDTISVNVTETMKSKYVSALDIKS